MKILLLTDADAFAGTERHMLELAIEARKCGVEVCLGCPAGAPLAVAAREHGVAVVGIEKRGTLDWRAVATLVGLLRRGRVDLIHAHNGRVAWLAALACSIARRGRLVSTMHFIHPARGSRKGLSHLLSSAIHRFIKRRLSVLIAISDAVRDEALRRGDLQAECIRRVYNGVAQPKVQRSREEVRGELGIDASTPLLISAIRLEREKSVTVLIDAVKQLVGRGVTSFRLIIVGRGSLHEAIAADIHASGLDRQVELLGFRDDVHDLMAAADALVHPAEAEPFGLVLAEAMALGKPVLAADGGAAPEIVRPDETGLLFKPGDASDLAQQLATLINTTQRAAWGEAGRLAYEQAFTADRMAAETVAIYREVLGVDTAVAPEAEVSCA